MSKKTITVRNSDGELLEVDEAAALELRIVYDNEDDRYTNVYRVENVTSTILAEMIEQFKHQVNEPNLTDSEWQTQVLESDIPVMVEFWSSWSGPCHLIQPSIDQLAKDYAGKFKFCKVNTRKSPNIATRYMVRGTPTVLIFKDGEMKERIIGVVPRETFEEAIEKILVE